ncbi:MAG: succinylglutamate desuccinylase/aspartoacylase family protein [Granulosicoccus sp.]
MTKAPSQTHTVDLDLGEPAPSKVQDAHLLGLPGTMLTVDISQTGKQFGHLVVPVSESPLRDGHIRLPVCVVRGKTSGPTVTLIAGVHGDEFEGPLTLQKLSRELNADAVSGCVILVPSINLMALESASRNSPHDQRDMDLCFPGKPNGTLSERVAFEIFERLIRPANLVIDLRSGGSTLNFAPLAAVRAVNGSRVKSSSAHTHEQIRQNNSEEAMFAFGAPNCVRLPLSTPLSCLQTSVNDLGIPYIQSELGGGGGCSAETLSIAYVGCNNVLRQQGVLHDEIQLRSSRILEVRDSTFYVQATTSGMLEFHGRLGANIYQGDALASLIDLHDAGSQPHVIITPKNSVLLAIRHAGPVKTGDLIAILAEEVPQ